jgi:hypothetical protein
LVGAVSLPISWRSTVHPKRIAKAAEKILRYKYS